MMSSFIPINTQAQTRLYVDIPGRVSGKSVPDVRVLNRFE